MAVLTYYLTDTIATSPGWFALLDPVAPTSANTRGRNAVGKLATNSYAKYQLAGFSAAQNVAGTQTTSYIDSKTTPTAGTAATFAAIGDSFRTPATLTGTFPAGNWSIAIALGVSTGTITGAMHCRVYHGANVDGTGATEVTSGALIGSTVTASTAGSAYPSSITWSAPSFSVTAEYLFFQVEFREDATTGGTSNTASTTLRVGTDTVITTTNLGTGAVAAPFTHYRSKHRIRR